MELKELKGISEKRLKDLEKLKIFNCNDLIKHFPTNYLDLRNAIKITECAHNDFALTKAKIVSEPTLQNTNGRRKLSIVRVCCEQDGDFFDIVWFNQPYVKEKLVVGNEYFFYGRVNNRFLFPSMTNPTFELFEKNDYLQGIVPVYSISGSITQKLMRSLIRQALNLSEIKSIIPKQFLQRYNLMPLKDALIKVHNPLSFEEKDLSADRIAIEEYFILISAFKLIKGDGKTARQNIYSSKADDIVNFTKRFNFEFTEGQKKAVNDIFSDMRSPIVMNRLLQGDVGSGKTAVSLCAIYLAVKSGYQVAMVSPTEVLAEQNYSLIKRYIPEFESCFLSGSISKKDKDVIKDGIIGNKYRIVCGTHAVFQKDVKFRKLSLCICDEQQRFGVAQRSSLVDKGNVPDVLVMSATPIPRTLSLIFYGDLDISTILDKPKARSEVKTSYVAKDKYDKMLSFVESEISKGNQAFFVCPKIESDEEATALSVKEIYNEIKYKLPQIEVGLLHGRMKDSEKTEIMQDFKDKKINALVSTTVIEVGIDIPDATVMVIYGADRFGLSQLHQLRGRVGRNDKVNYCFLLCDSPSEKAVERLSVLKNNSDGFKISEFDYESRGGGDFMGTKQSGKMISDLGRLNYSVSSIFFAKKLVEEVFISGENFNQIKQIALQKYEKLRDVTLN